MEQHGIALDDTGERLMTDNCDHVTVEHLHRYAIAASLCRGKEVLDIASGEGYGSRLLSDFAKRVFGVDISPDAVAHATNKYQKENVEFRLGSTDQIPLKDASVDVVVSFETIEHHARHDEMISEIKRVLRPDGMLVISSPDKLNYTDLTGWKNPFHVKELYREEFLALLKGHFSSVEMLLQRIVYGSLIVSDGAPRGFREYGGGFDDMNSFGELQRPFYNICIASDAPTAPMSVSFYDGWPVLESMVQAAHRDGMNAVLESRAYRIGRALTWPARKLRGR